MSTGLKLAQVRVENMKRLGYGRVSENRCPRRLVGKRHEGEKCWCTSPLNDHGGTYRSQGRKVVLWEPYSGWPDEFTDTFTAAAADGLRVVVHGRSAYRPGHTIAIEFTRAVR